MVNLYFIMLIFAKGENDNSKNNYINCYKYIKGNLNTNLK